MAEAWHYRMVSLPWPGWNDGPMCDIEADGWTFVDMCIWTDRDNTCHVNVLYKKKH